MTNKSNKLDEIIDNLTVGHIAWAHDQLDGTSHIEQELKIITEREIEAKQAITGMINDLIGEKPREDVVSDSGIGYSKEQFKSLILWEQQRRKTKEKYGLEL